MDFSEILRKIYLFFLDGLQTFLLAASFFLIIYIFLFRPFQVSGNSMYSTFKNGEFILTGLINLKLEELKRGDVVVFNSPDDPEKDYIKRVIGVPGDTVTILGGQVYVNDQPLDEPYLDEGIRTSGGAAMKEGVPVTVPEDHYIVIGDNRPNSSDSREWGPLQRTKIIGKSLFVYWPFTDMRAIKNPFEKK